MLLTILLIWFVISIPATLITGAFLALGSKSQHSETSHETQPEIEVTSDISLEYVN